MNQIKNAVFGVSSLALFTDIEEDNFTDMYEDNFEDMMYEDQFGDVPSTTFSNVAKPSTAFTPLIIVILIIIVIRYILLLIATYKLTNSALQTVLCFLFGIIYLTFAYIYYGFSGYKFTKKF